MSALEEEDHYPVFVPLSLLPQQEDHPIGTHKTHESHTERHRNTSDYVAVHNATTTNRYDFLALIINRQQVRRCTCVTDL